MENVAILGHIANTIVRQNAKKISELQATPQNGKNIPDPHAKCIDRT